MLAHIEHGLHHVYILYLYSRAAAKNTGKNGENITGTTVTVSIAYGFN